MSTLHLARLSVSCLALSSLLFSLPASAAFGPVIHSDDSDRAAGDIIQIALPAIGLGATLYQGDVEGSKQWAYSVGSTLLAIAALKQAFNDTAWGMRPNGGPNSFPSGHASAACSGASFIGQRYGWSYGALAMLPAAFVGYSRVDEGLHHWRDVAVGCAIGAGFSLLFVEPKAKPAFSVIPEIGPHALALAFHMDY
jgi:membrane-associated phospholipid phosphatase